MDTTFNLDVLPPPPPPKNAAFSSNEALFLQPYQSLSRLICLLHTCILGQIPSVVPPTVHPLYCLFLRHIRVHACASRLQYLILLLCRYDVRFVNVIAGGGGGTVVKVLRYKSGGRWFDSKWCHWNLSLT
jgi:hypothetical protein